MKNVFSCVIRFAASASAALLLTMCNKTDIVPGSPVSEDPSGDVIHVSVHATVASMDVRSTFGENKITIEHGDVLQVAAYHKEGESYAYYYSGTLTNTGDAPGTFSGDLERDPAFGSYSGSDILHDAAVTATLLPDGSDPSVEFLEGLSGGNVAKLCTMQATKEEGSNPIFALKPSVAVARFTVSGLGDIQGQNAYILVKYVDNNGTEHSVEGSVPVGGSGTAAFSVGIASTGSVRSLTLGIHGETENVHIDNRVWYDGIIIVDGERALKDIINISREATKTKYSATSTFDRNDIGKIFSTNGHLFSSVAAAEAAGTSPLCMITCLKSEIRNPGYIEGTDAQMQNGLAMGLYPLEVDGATKLTRSDAKAHPGGYRTCESGVTVACEGMPSLIVLERMAQCCGSSASSVSGTNYLADDRLDYNSRGLKDKLFPAIKAATGTTDNNLFFWTSATRTKNRVDYPVHWENDGFYMSGLEVKYASYAYYMF